MNTKHNIKNNISLNISWLSEQLSVSEKCVCPVEFMVFVCLGWDCSPFSLSFVLLTFHSALRFPLQQRLITQMLWRLLLTKRIAASVCCAVMDRWMFTARVTRNQMLLTLTSIISISSNLALLKQNIIHTRSGVYLNLFHVTIENRNTTYSKRL